MFVEVHCLPDTVKCLICFISVLGDSFHLFILYFLNAEATLAMCWLECSIPCGLKFDSQDFLEDWQVGLGVPTVKSVMDAVSIALHE